MEGPKHLEDLGDGCLEKGIGLHARVLKEAGLLNRHMQWVGREVSVLQRQDVGADLLTPHRSLLTCSLNLCIAVLTRLCKNPPEDLQPLQGGAAPACA